MKRSQLAAATALYLCGRYSAAAESFDYIVIGAGPGGLTVANRLSENPNVSVAIIDPGPDQRHNPNVTDPAIWTNNLASAAANWDYTSVPQPNADGQTFAYNAGYGIGGTSLINGMTYVRADKAEIDAWENLGNPGLNWDSLFPYYRDTTRFTPPNTAQKAAGAFYDPSNYGNDGPIHVGFPFTLTNGSFYSTASETWTNLSLPINPDANGGITHGFDVWPQTLDRDLNIRWDAATAFYWPVQNRPNLKLVNGTAIKATWASAKKNGSSVVSGVEILIPRNKSIVLCASKEVIVSAGALRTPLFLELSGIGNPTLLSQHNISVVEALPAVGENLQDQPNTNIIYTFDQNLTGTAPYSTFPTARDLFGSNVSAVASSTRASLSSWAKQVSDASGGALNSSALEKIYAIQHDLIYQKNVTVTEIITTASGSAFLNVWIPLLPFSRGSVHISSPDSIDKPLIDPRFFLIDHDLEVDIASGKLSQKFFQTQPAKQTLTSYLSPGDAVLPQNATDAQWVSYSKKSFSSNSHPLATAAMMSRDLGGVVDTAFKVYGISNLRIVDASVLPTQFSGHLTATIYAMAERAVEMIKKDA